MSFDLAKIIHSMGGFALGIAATLVLMAVASLAVFVERLWAFSRSRSRSRDFAASAGALLDQGNLGKLQSEAEAASKRGAHLAQLLGAGVKTYLQSAGKPSAKVPPVELARRELARRLESIGADLRRGMSLLASVGSVAPFVGLLGTVVGIITAFEGIAKEGSGGLGAVSSGIAEALVVTALGLFVAIPTVLAFNLLSSRVDAIVLALEQAQGELVDLLESGIADFSPAPVAKNGSAARAALNVKDVKDVKDAKDAPRGKTAEPAQA